LRVAAPSFLGQQDRAQASKLAQQEAVAYKAAKADSAGQTPQGTYETGAPLVAAITASEPELDNIVTASALTPGQSGLIQVEATNSGAGFCAEGYTPAGDLP
jgi:hypothetical protein